MPKLAPEFHVLHTRLSVKNCLLLLVFLLVPLPALGRPCPWAVTPEASQKLYENMRNSAPLAEDCTLGDQTVQQNVVQQQWQKGPQHIPLHWAARACTTGDDPRLEPLEMQLFSQQCPQTATRLALLAQSPDWPRATLPIPSDQLHVLHTDIQLVQATAVLEVLVLLGLLLWLLLGLRQLWLTPELRVEWQLGVGVLILALLSRFLTPPTLSNWYTPTLGLQPEPRAELYGSGHAALQWLLRAVLPWTDTTIFATNQLLGALVPPLWFVALRQRKIHPGTAALAGALLAVLPLHVRLSASASEHVLAATAWMGALVAWQSSLRQERWMPRIFLGLLGMALGALTALTRVDTAPLVLTLALWTLLADPEELPPRLARRWIYALLLLLVWVVTFALVFPLVQTAVLAHGTPLPQWADRQQAMHDFLPGLRRLAFASPGWIGPLVGSAVLFGLLRGLLQIPVLTVTLVLTFLCVPLGIGRSPYDFVMMRYYLPVLPLLTLPAALAFQSVVTRKWLGPLVIVLTVLLGWRAWQVRYAFQDEYTWLLHQLEQQNQPCTVAQVAVGNRYSIRQDVDCCLDLTRCPLIAALPTHTFVQTDTQAELLAVKGNCVLYYEGAVCAMADTPEMLNARAPELAWFRQRCAEVHQTPGLVKMAETHVTPRGHRDAFGRDPVPVRLWRLQK